MTRLEDLERMGPRRLLRAFRSGSPVDPAWLADQQWLGWSIGQPRAVTWLTWKHFKKVVRRDEEGRLHGWNVSVTQDGTFRDREAHGEPVTYGHFTVQRGADETLIDYRGAGNKRRDPLGLLVDPVVTLTPGRPELLLGYTRIGVATPTFFALIPGGPLTHTVRPPRTPTRLGVFA